MLNYSTLDIDEGGSATLTATTSPTGQTVTWSSSNTTVATVSSAGKITAKKAGTATITAKLSDGTQDTCTVYVTLADGVYYIENVGAGCYLGISEDLESGTSAYLQTKDTSSTGRLVQLWKVKYVSDGKYIVRPMTWQKSGLYMDGTDVNVTGINIADSFSAVPTQAQWQIYYTTAGYAILNNGSSSAMMMAQGTTSSSNVGVASATSINTYFWSFERAYGVFLYDKSTMYPTTASTEKYLELGDSFSLSDLNLALQPYGTVSSLTWSSSNTSVATVNSSGKVTSVGRGVSTITVTAMIYGTTYTHQYTLIVIETVYVVNYYDSTLENDSTKLGYIDEAVSYLNTVFNDILHIHFEMDGTPQQYQNAPVDICSTYGCTSQCQSPTCGDTCASHHKNLKRISLELYQNFSAKNHVVVLWSNCGASIYCLDDGYNDACRAQNPLAFVASVTPGETTSNRPVIQFLTIDQNFTLDDDQVVNMMAIVLAHEIAHTLFLGEIYEDWYEDNPNHESDGVLCIMDVCSPYVMGLYGNSSVSPLCDYCVDKITSVCPDDVYENYYED